MFVIVPPLSSAFARLDFKPGLTVAADWLACSQTLQYVTNHTCETGDWQ